MPVRIKIAETAAELENLFVARHKVFVEEEGYLAERENGRILDQFDAFPTTTNIIALMDDQVIGGIRVTTCSSAGLPSDHFYNFSPLFQDNPGAIAGVSQFFLRKSRRANKYRIAIALMGMCAYWAKMQNQTQLVAAVNPVIAPLLKLVGMKPVGAEFFHRGEGVHVLPMDLDMQQIKEPIASIVKRQSLHRYHENFDREYYLPGEQIEAGFQAGSEPFCVLDGKVTVHDLSSDTKGHPEKTPLEIGPGQSLNHFDRNEIGIHLVAGRKTELIRMNQKPYMTRIPGALDYMDENVPFAVDSTSVTTVH